MQIELNQYEVMDAIEKYISTKYDFNVDLYTSCHEININYVKKTRVYKKHKNGKPIINAHGHPEIDHANEIREDAHIMWGECDSISLYIEAE